MRLYYITDRNQFAGNEVERRRKLLDKIQEAAEAGVDWIQLRERDLPGRELEHLASDALAAVRAAGTATRLLINSRVDVALASAADGVHLRSDDISASDGRAIANRRSDFIVGVSCHTVEEVRSAWSHGADFTVFAPVFDKGGVAGSGIPALRQASKVAEGFVMALGGVTLENAQSCRSAGAAGVAGIRLFQDRKVVGVVSALRIP